MGIARPVFRHTGAGPGISVAEQGMPFASPVKNPTLQAGTVELIMRDVHQELTHLEPGVRLLVAQLRVRITAHVDAFVSQLLLQEAPKDL
jgi:hypothetical protein